MAGTSARLNDAGRPPIGIRQGHDALKIVTVTAAEAGPSKEHGSRRGA